MDPFNDWDSMFLAFCFKVKAPWCADPPYKLKYWLIEQSFELTDSHFLAASKKLLKRETKSFFCLLRKTSGKKNLRLLNAISLVVCAKWFSSWSERSSESYKQNKNDLKWIAAKKSFSGAVQQIFFFFFESISEQKTIFVFFCFCFLFVILKAARNNFNWISNFACKIINKPSKFPSSVDWQPTKKQIKKTKKKICFRLVFFFSA